VLGVVGRLVFSHRGRRQSALGTPTTLVAWHGVRFWARLGFPRAFIRIMTNLRRYSTNLELYGANSSATVKGHEHETHEPCVCLCRLRMPLAVGGRSLSGARGRDRGTRGDIRRSASRSAEDTGGGTRKSKTASPALSPPSAPVKCTPWILAAMRVAAIVWALLTSLPAYADSEGTEAIAESVRFTKLVDAGDRARRAHHYAEAFAIYNKALDIRSDPAVEGRLGLVLLETGGHAMAAEYLLRAITKAQAPPNLMRQFHDAFARVRPKVCFVEVFVSEQGAEVLIDGKQEPESDHNAWHVFITAGSHTFLAKLDGFENATKTIDIPAGGELGVRLDLKPLPPPPPVQEEPTPNPDPKPRLVGKPSNRLSDSYTNFNVGAGGVFVLGATPGVALGPQLTSGVRRWFVSLNVDGRIAWPLATPERNTDLQLISWAVGVRPCAHYAFVFGCGVVQVDGLSSLSGAFEPKARIGGGVRGGFEFVIRKPFRLQVWADAVFRSKGYDITTDEKGLSIGSPVLFGFGATTFLTF